MSFRFSAYDENIFLEFLMQNLGPVLGTRSAFLRVLS